MLPKSHLTPSVVGSFMTKSPTVRTYQAALCELLVLCKQRSSKQAVKIQMWHLVYSWPFLSCQFRGWQVNFYSLLCEGFCWGLQLLRWQWVGYRTQYHTVPWLAVCLPQWGSSTVTGEAAPCSLLGKFTLMLISIYCGPVLWSHITPFPDPLFQAMTASADPSSRVSWLCLHLVLSCENSTCSFQNRSMTEQILQCLKTYFKVHRVLLCNPLPQFYKSSTD